MGRAVARGTAMTAALALGLAGSLGAATPAHAAPVFTITDSRIAESSGLAADPSNDVVWTVNDGSQPRVFALDPGTGKVKATITFRGEPVDLEAVARSGARLYLGDIGDNEAKRHQISVFALNDPQIADGNAQYNAWDFVYPDRKGHDAEALLVNPSGQIFIVTKEAKGGIYTFPGTPKTQGTNKLTRVGDAPAFVTDGTFLPDGRLALRTYVGVFVLDSGYAVTAQAPLPSQPQGESLTTTMDGKKLLVGSEGKKSTVLEVEIPTTKKNVPTASASPPTGKATGTAGDEDEAPDASRDPEGVGLAVLGALGVALLAGAVPFLLGRRRGADPEPTEPKPTEPKPTEPEPTAPEPTEPKPTAPEPETAEEKPMPERDDVPGRETPAPAAEDARPQHALTEPVATTEASEPDSDDLREERGDGRSTWAEPRPAEPTADEIGRRREADDLDWLYEER